MPELFDTTYFRGQGPVFLGSRDAAGNPVGMQFIGDTGQITITPSIERFKINENVSGAGSVASSGIKSTEFGVSINFRSVKASHLAIAMQGDLTANASGSVTDEAHTVKLDKMSPMANVKISTVVVTGSGGTPTYVENTDYKVHGDEGMIEWLSGGTVTEDLAVLVDYAFAAQTEVRSNPQNVDKYMVFAGMNTENSNKQHRVELYKVQLDPGSLNLITDEGDEYSVSGTLLLDTLRPSGDQLFGLIAED